jgi:hypothetical protein
MQAANAKASKNSRLLIPNISSDYTVNYNIVCGHITDTGRKIVVAMIAHVIGSGIVLGDGLNGLLFRCHGFIIPDFSGLASLCTNIFELLQTVTY